MGELLCLVVGAFGKVAEDLERTIKAIAESRALYLSRESGQPVSEARAGWILGQYRRLLSCLFIRSQASCLLARMGHLGEGAKECAARRRVAMAEEERMKREGKMERQLSVPYHQAPPHRSGHQHPHSRPPD